MRLVEEEGDRLSFAFVDGANLDDPERHHQHAFLIRFVDADTFERSETYVANGASADARATAKAEPATTFERIAK